MSTEQELGDYDQATDSLYDLLAILNIFSFMDDVWLDEQRLGRVGFTYKYWKGR